MYLDASARSELLRLASEAAGLHFQIKLLRSICNRKYNPDQPRAPAGTTEEGRWVGSGAGEP